MADLVTSALNPTLRLLGGTLLATPDLTGNPRIRELWTGSQVAANAVFVLFILAGGALVMANESLQTRYSLKEILPRLFGGMVAANVSLEVIGRLLEFANALNGAVVGEGLDPASTGERLTQLLVGSIRDGGSFMLILGLVAAVLALVVTLTYVIRVSITVLLVIAAPLFLICHGSPATEGAATFWWRALAGCLVIQLGQAVTMLAALRVFFTPEGFNLLGLPTDSAGLVNLLVAVCLLWILARIPTWVSRSVFTSRRSTVVGIVRSIVIVKALGAVGVLPRRRAAGP